MRLCKYCNKPIAENDIWNPDNYGNGYHHKCLVHMELKARNKQIYDKGKMDVLDKIRAEIEKARETEIKEFNEENDLVEPSSYQRGLHEGYDTAIDNCLSILDKYKAEREDKE